MEFYREGGGGRVEAGSESEREEESKRDRGLGGRERDGGCAVGSRIKDPGEAPVTRWCPMERRGLGGAPSGTRVPTSVGTNNHSWFALGTYCQFATEIFAMQDLLASKGKLCPWGALRLL